MGSVPALGEKTAPAVTCRYFLLALGILGRKTQQVSCLRLTFLKHKGQHLFRSVEWEGLLDEAGLEQKSPRCFGGEG